jgi:hypothetical protein
VKLNLTHLLLVCANDNLLGKNTVKKNTEAGLSAMEGVSLDVNTENTMFMFMDHHQNAGQKSYCREE